MTALWFDRVAAPAGAPFSHLLIALHDEALVALDFAGFEARMERLLAKRYATFRFVEQSDPCGVTTALGRYLSGQLNALSHIQVSTGGTPFQQAAWLALRTIPAGTTATYTQQAQRIGRPKAVRAIGAANGQNPVAIVLPCHRVVGAQGALTGYAGGVTTKAWLLRHEAAHTR